MEAVKYGKLLNRLKAVIVDTLIIGVLGVLASTILEKFANVPDAARLIAFLFVFFLYDPLLTSSIGGTVGHLIIGLRVRRESNETKKIIFPLALVRFLIKATLGFISLLTVSSNSKKKAIHDSLVNSVVIEV
jgi:uncharacterized RDD family membrane protein YckC